MKWAALLAIPLAATFAFAQTPSSRAGSEDPAHARVEMKTAKGENAGFATLTETPNGLILRYTPFKLPAGTHAIHLHETGRCDAPSFESAGGHFNPTNAQHGFKDAAGPHAGDLPNVYIANGRGAHDFFVNDVTLKTGKTALVDGDGAALVVHAGADDYQSEPAGDAGTRIACGVIQ